MTAPAEPRTDGMIALVPADPAALAVPGGDPAEQIHLTLAYLGDNAAAWPDEMTAMVQLLASEVASWAGPQVASIFAYSVWNVGAEGKEPATVYELTDGDREMLADIHRELCWAVRDAVGEALFPVQHEPYRPHVTAGYGVPVEALTATGPVLFDRLRVAIGGQVTDYPLGGANPLAQYSAGTGAQLMTQAITAAAEDATVPDIADGVPVVLTVVVEGMATSDGRFIEADALTHRALPLPILAQTANPDGGDGHDGAFVIGRMDTLVRLPGPEVIDKETGQPFPEGVFVWQATGELDPNHPATDLVRRGYLTGNSADLVGVDAEMIYPEPEDDDDLAALFAAPDEIRLHAGVIAATTLVPIPAFASAYVQLDGADVVPADDLDTGLVASAWRSADLGDSTCLPCAAEQLIGAEAQRRTIVAAINAVAPEDLPDAALFADPELPELTMPLQVEGPGGRVYGHLAPWDVCHIGYSNACVTAPHSATGYAHFHTGSVLANRDGEPATLPTGVLTIGTGHAPEYANGNPLTPRAAAEHYDHTGTVLADVVAGEDAHGIWVSGRVRPDATAEQCAALRAAPLSGDWRNIGGNLELVAALGVNTPGFRPQARARVASGAMQSLVASLAPAKAVVDDVQRLAEAVAERLRAMGQMPLAVDTPLAQRRSEALRELEKLALEQRKAAALRPVDYAGMVAPTSARPVQHQTAEGMRP